MGRTTAFRITLCLLLASVLASAQSKPPLDRYTTCKWDSRFQTVQTDRLPEAMARAIKTKSGETSVQLLDGYRVLITYDYTEPFINMKVEQLGATSYATDKQALIENLEVITIGTPGMESNLPSHSRSGLFDVYGINRKELVGGVLSTYTLFNDADKTVTTVYFLNAEPSERKFKTTEEYRKLRDDFLNEYAACLQPVRSQKP